MEEKYNWKLEDIFPSMQKYEETKEEIKRLLNEIKKYQGILCDTPENLYNCYKLDEEALEKFEKV